MSHLRTPDAAPPAPAPLGSAGGGVQLVQLGRREAPAADLKIGDLAKLSGKSQRALRLYEELGLLTPGTRTAGGFRVYGAEAIARVEWIGKLQELGFTLVQIQELVAATVEQAPKEAMARVRGLFEAKQSEVQQQIARLTQLSKELQQSLGYLETCVDDCAESAVNTGTTCCGTCQQHGAEAAPSLVHGVRTRAPEEAR